MSIALMRKMLYAGMGATHPMEAHKIESRAIWARGASADAKEGVSAFLEKRAAVFPDAVSDAWDSFAPWFDEPRYG